MYNISREIKKCKAEIERLKNEIVEFVKLRDDYESGRRDMREDYPMWRHPFHRTPMDWVNYRIGGGLSQVKILESKLKELYKERSWLEVEYYRPLDYDDVCGIIHKDGYIVGIKL